MSSTSRDRSFLSAEGPIQRAPSAQFLFGFRNDPLGRGRPNRPASYRTPRMTRENGGYRKNSCSSFVTQEYLPSYRTLGVIDLLPIWDSSAKVENQAIRD